jgi:hypothetical protein
MRTSRTRRWDGAPETGAEQRFFDLREAGYTGPIDQNGYPVVTDDDVAAEQAALLANNLNLATYSRHLDVGPRPSTGGRMFALMLVGLAVFLVLLVAHLV